MKVYDSYAEAKIANPESDIYERMCVDFATADYVSLVAMCGAGEGWNKCNPADHCMTVDQFIAEGHRFANGDICLDDGDVVTVKCRAEWDEPSPGDNERYVLRAAALDVMAQDNEATETKAVAEYSNEKPKRVKVEFVRIDFTSDKEKAEAFLEGGLRYFTHGKVTGDLEHDTIPVTKLEQMFSGNGIYRRVETEIDERQEFIDKAKAIIDSTKTAEYSLGAMFDAGCRFTD